MSECQAAVCTRMSCGMFENLTHSVSTDFVANEGCQVIDLATAKTSMSGLGL